MSLYAQYIFPHICELALNNRHIARYRAELLAHADGEILEIGIGTGLNLAYYPPRVRRITAVDPNPGMHRWAADRIAATQIEVDKRVIGGEQLPFDAGRFDCVVTTFTLCSISEVERALGEMFRVLKPGGKLLFLEHGLSRDPGVARWQQRINGLERLLADDCRLNRCVRDLVQLQPYAKFEIEEFYAPKMPWTHGYLTRGFAVK